MPDLLRSAVLSNYVEVARSVGLNPYDMVRAVGLSQACLVEPDLKIPAVAALQLLEQSAALSGQENFGLRMAESRRLSILGQLGLVARDAPTVRHMLEIVIRYMGLHNEALRLRLEDAGKLTTIRQDLLIPKARGFSMRQSSELSLGGLMRVLRIYMPEDWLPRRVCFMHPSPLDLGLHRRLFGPTLEFGSEFDGIVCKSRDLDTPIAASDPVMAAYAQRQLESLLRTAVEASMEREVRHLVLLLLPTGRCNIDYVARHLGVHRRTIHRQLAEAGLSFSAIVSEVRGELSQRYLAQTQRTLAEVAELLGFSALSAYSRWHQTTQGQTASARRAELLADAGRAKGQR